MFKVETGPRSSAPFSFEPEAPSPLLEELERKMEGYDPTKMIERAVTPEDLNRYELTDSRFLTPIQALFKRYVYRDIFKGKVEGVTHISGQTSVSVIALELFPRYVLKIPSEDFERWSKEYRTAMGEYRPCEANSLALRPSVAYLMRHVIATYDLDLLHVPRKWTVTLKDGKVGVLAERCSIATLTETHEFLRNLSKEEQKKYALQVVILIALTGGQDIGLHNIRVDLSTKKLIFFDTEPYGNIACWHSGGRDAEKDLALVGLQNFKESFPFDKAVKEEVVQAAKTFFRLRFYRV